MEIKKKQKNKIKEIAQEFNLKLVLLFGSQVTGKTNFSSDFDIAYLPKQNLNGKTKIDLNCRFMDVFNTDKIDLVNLNQTSLLLKYEISRNSQLLYGDEISYLNFKASAFKLYIEAKPLFEMRDNLLKKRHKFLQESLYNE